MTQVQAILDHLKGAAPMLSLSQAADIFTMIGDCHADLPELIRKHYYLQKVTPMNREPIDAELMAKKACWLFFPKIPENLIRHFVLLCINHLL
jgi:hypothetical protein